MIHGIEVQTSKHLPETVKDKNGQDVKLLGVMIDPSFLSLYPGEFNPRKIMILTEQTAKDIGVPVT